MLTKNYSTEQANMNQTSYYVSRHSDGRDAIEIVTASGFEDAADRAVLSYGMQPINRRVHVTHNGETREIEVEWAEEIKTFGLDDIEPQTGEELL